MKKPFFSSSRPVVIFLLLFGCLFYHQGTDYHFAKWCLLLTLAFVWVAYVTGTVLNSTLSAWVFSYIVMSGFMVFSYRGNFYTKVDPQALVGFSANSAESTLSFILLVIACASFGKDMYRLLHQIFSAACVTSSFLIVLHALLGKTHSLSTGGFFDQGSMEGVFIAVTYPALIMSPGSKGKLKLWELISFFLPMIAGFVLCLKAEASQPIVLITIALFLSYSIMWKKVKNKPFTLTRFQLLILFLFICSAVGMLGQYLNPRFLDNNGRFAIYKNSMSWLINGAIDAPQSPLNTYNFFGMGTGSFSIWGPWLQYKNDVLKGSNFIFMHSDWLQLWFENGLFGMFLVMILGAEALVKSFFNQNDIAFVTLIVFACAMVFQYPFHESVIAFVGMTMLCEALKGVDV